MTDKNITKGKRVASDDGLGFPVWHAVTDVEIPCFKWILVKNTSGFMAAVNEVTHNKETGDINGWTLTPEEETHVISCITHWANIKT
ncbi:MAG: hypothetical protein HY081_00570 [Gammaproteobacteria bacterium]|nr:hypothetical protein [Gammaproteobacteria bacterium]